MKFNIILLTVITLSTYTPMSASDKQHNFHDASAQETPKDRMEPNSLPELNEPITCMGMFQSSYDPSDDLTQKTLTTYLSDLISTLPRSQARPIIIALICLGADANLRISYDDRTLLHAVARQNDFSLTQFLLNQGAAADAKDKDNVSPLFLLADNCVQHNKYPSVVISTAELLLRNGAELSPRARSAYENFYETGGKVQYETAAELAHRRYTRYGASSCKDLADFLNDWDKQSIRIQE